MSASITDERPFLTLAEIARRTNLSLRTVERFRDRGDLVAFKLGHQWRVEPEEFDRFLDVQRRRGAGP